MTVQSISALLTLLAILALAGVFLRVRLLANTPQDYAPVQARAYRIRAIGFGILLLVGLPISIWLLRVHPYATAATPPQIVNVTANQWYWEFDPAEAVIGQPVEFRVTSTDVNHNFGLYDETGRLVAQTQAMPGYVNQLTYTFEAPGTYQVLCLEYCGLAHHGMVSEFTATTAGESND
jgi:cytochrome c oxidase subunit 2